MAEVGVNLGLIGLIILQQVFYMRQIQKLVDKLMSRNIGEYQRAVTPQQPKEQKEVMMPYPEDLSVLSRV